MNEVLLTDKQLEWLEAHLEAELDGAADEDAEVIYSILEEL